MLTKIIRILVVSTIFLTVFESIIGLLFVFNLFSFAESKDYAIKTAFAILIIAVASLLVSSVLWFSRKQ